MVQNWIATFWKNDLSIWLDDELSMLDCEFKTSWPIWFIFYCLKLIEGKPIVRPLNGDVKPGLWLQYVYSTMNNVVVIFEGKKIV